MKKGILPALVLFGTATSAYCGDEDVAEALQAAKDLVGETFSYSEVGRISKGVAVTARIEYAKNGDRSLLLVSEDQYVRVMGTDSGSGSYHMLDGKIFGYILTSEGVDRFFATLNDRLEKLLRPVFPKSRYFDFELGKDISVVPANLGIYMDIQRRKTSERMDPV